MAHQHLQFRRLRSLLPCVVLLVGAIAALLLCQPAPAAPQLYPSVYASTVSAAFNQPSFYPITLQTPANYRPVGDWVGRLVLPSVEQYQQVAQSTQETDWAWLEVQVAPAEAQAWVGKTVRLAWQPTPLTQAYVAKASRDVRFPPEVQKTLEAGILHPARLNGRNRVGPLQSLAGARPLDDVTVVLRGGVKLDGTPESAPVLRIEREPVQETGRYMGLVQLVEAVPPAKPEELPSQCPGEPPCASNRFRVRHYNLATRQFDGATEMIRIPQQPQDKDGVFNATTRDLVTSPAGTLGWYIAGAPDQTGLFTVQAMQPRSLVQLQPQQTLLGRLKGLDYIQLRNWETVEERKGTIQTVLLDLSQDSPDAVQQSWKEGDSALVMHLFGGRGGTHAAHESLILGTYAGHFSFGLAEVVRDPFTNDLIFNVDYLQVYGNGSDGTVSGAQTWRNYMGSLVRGKAATRPVSDGLVKLDTLTDEYNFGGTRLSFLNELLGELSLISARYRIGDGTGDSTITSATSCVQDSAQGLFLAIVRFRQTVEANPQVMDWMRTHPDDPTTQRFERLVILGRQLADQLTPMGVVRWDWAQNAEVLTGVRVTAKTSQKPATAEASDQAEQFVSISDFQIRNLLTGLVSWRTALPRQAHDELAMLFLTNGAKLWFLRPNQIGGSDPGIAPLEATLAMGGWKLPLTQIPIFSVLLHRTFGGLTIPSLADWLTAGALLGWWAISTRFLSKTTRYFSPLRVAQTDGSTAMAMPWWRSPLTVLRLLFIPALLSEYLFRVLLLPYPKPWIPEWSWWAWAVVALGLQVLLVWLPSGQFCYPQWASRARSRAVGALLLGIACTIAYRYTGSLWTITVMHWLAVSVGWLGRSRRE
jgi:predicted Abi (CAAX) family protease